MNVFDKCFFHKKYQIIIIKLLKGQFLQKQFRKELIFIIYVFFSILLWNSEPPCIQTAFQNSISRDLRSCKLVHNSHRNKWINLTLGVVERLKNSDFILEVKMAELNQKKNSKQRDRPDAVCKLYFTLKINE